MRILKVSQTYAPFYEFGGPPAKVEALANGLAQRGHRVTVLTADWGYEKRASQEPPGGTLKRSPFGWAREANGVESIYLPTWARYRALSWNPALGRYCRARLGQFEMAHIYGLYDFLGPGVASACRTLGIPYVVEPIGMFLPIVRNITMKRIYHGLWGKELLAGAAKIIATSEQEVEELLGGGIARTKIVLRRNGVMAPKELPERGRFRLKYGLPEQARVILFLGRLSQKKSPDLLLSAFAQLAEQAGAEDIRLVFCGPDESGMKERLATQAERSGLKERVTFTGAIFGEEKWAAYRDADVFVLPSQNENFGNTAMEAAACGVPVIVTDTCGVASLLAGGAGIVVQHETSQVARAVKQVLFDGQLRGRLAQGGKDAAARLGWDEPVSQMELLYGKLATSRS